MSTTEIRHGEYSTYSNGRCGCQRCKAAFAAKMRSLRQARHAERINVNGRLIHPNATHGTTTGYVYYGCQCEACTIANRHRRPAAAA